MRNYFLLMTALACFISNSHLQPPFCRNSCKDKLTSIMCFTFTFKFGCGGLAVRIFCPLTCHVCTPCIDGSRFSDISSKTLLLKDCETGTCVDNLPQDQCSVIAEYKPSWCESYGVACRKSCRLCVECEIPPDPCTTDCNNKHKYCNEWKLSGFCKRKSKYYGYMEGSCPLACGFCKQCPTVAPPNTKLPPTPSTEPPCTTGVCEDMNLSCKSWADAGYCNESKGFPYTQIACPKSCQTCIPCIIELPPPPPKPTEPECLEGDTLKSCEYCTPCLKKLPPPLSDALAEPVCSEDCKEINTSCDFWKEEGYCNEISEFRSFMVKECPIACTICRPCSEQEESIDEIILKARFVDDVKEVEDIMEKAQDIPA